MLQLHKNSGSARTAFENIHYFKSRGFEVHVAAMTMDKTNISETGAIPHKMFPWVKSTGLARRRWYNWQVKRLRKKLKPVLTVGHGDIQDQDVLTLHNCVFLAHELIHGEPLDKLHEMAQTHGQILEFQKFKKMIANSLIMKRDTISRFGVPAEKIHVIYPALDTKTFFPKPVPKISPKINVALVTSGNFKKRGLDIFSSAIDSLPQNIKDLASFRVIGNSCPGVSSSITFDPARDDIQNYYSSIDIFVLPARIEEFGRVALEAMGCGLPVITTNRVGAGELLVGESRRFVIPPNDSNALAAAITELVTDNQLRERIGKLNAETALNYSEEKVFSKFDQVFSDL